jgi:hypothetical protein
VSVQSIGINEIQRNPGGNQDISKVIQSLPGVASGLAFRNDLFIRGGGPNENRFFVDEIEVPVINHFATQGSSGGPAGILNVNLIKNVDLITGGFPANRMNGLSSFFEFQLKEGRRDRMATQLTVGASELTLSNEGPLSPKSTYILSARRSYLQGLFRLLNLPFLPTFNDFQVKTTTKINEKTELTFIGIGAIDQFVLNEEAPEEETQEEVEDETEESDDLVADLRELQDKLSTILSKLEGAVEETEDELGDESETGEYTEDDFDSEFDNDQEETSDLKKESIDKPKILPDSKGKQLLSKKNKVGNITSKGGKANQGKLKVEPKPKQLSSSAGASLQKGKPEVKSTVKKGDFIK